MADPETSGFLNLLGGCNTGLSPMLLPENQYARGLNVSVRNGLVRTRPVFKKIATLVGTYTKFQGAKAYRLQDVDRIVLGTDGRVHTFNLETENLSTATPTLDTSADTLYFAQADRYMVVQDGTNRPLFLHEDSLFRQARAYTSYAGTGDTPNEVFTGTHTAYGHGRIFTVARYVHGNDGQPGVAEGRPYFVAGDIIKPSNPEEVFEFSETTYLNDGGAAGMPAEFGFIQGMAFFRNIASGTGMGPLIVFGREGVGAFAVDQPRAPTTPETPGWSEIDFSQVLFSGIGTRSPRSILNVNDDLLFRAEDGIRSIRYTSSEIAAGSGALSATPSSHEVRYWLDMDTLADLPFVSSSVADNRILFTSASRTNDWFRAVTSLDTAPVYGITIGQASPAYDGIWTGLRFLQTLSARYDGEMRHLFIVRSSTDAVELWYLDEDATYDSSSQAPLCRVYTRSDSFESPNQFKRFSHIDLWVRELKGNADITVYFRPDGYELWTACNSLTIKSDASGQPQHRYRLRFGPQSEDLYDPITGANLLGGTSFQFCFQWEGNLAIEKAVYYATPESEEPPDSCCDGETTATALVEGTGGVLLDDFTYLVV